MDFSAYAFVFRAAGSGGAGEVSLVLYLAAFLALVGIPISIWLVVWVRRDIRRKSLVGAFCLGQLSIVIPLLLLQKFG